MVHHRKYPHFFLLLTLSWSWGQGDTNVAQFPLHRVTYAPAKFHVAYAPAKVEVAMSNSLGGDWACCQGHTKHWPKHCLAPSTSCDLYTCNLWICYVTNSFYKKIHFWTLLLILGSRSHKTLPSTHCIMWPMHL